MKTIYINDVFYSIQGEGKWMGLPNCFIRTMGCNLRCSYCDTTEAYDHGDERSLDEIITQIKPFHCDKVCITGGEPLLQEHIGLLMERLVETGYHVSVETNGSQSLKTYLSIPHLFFSMDIKCPSSGMHEKMHIENLSMIRQSDQIKYVVGNREDYDYAKKLCSCYKVSCPIFFQPVWGFSLATLAEWILEDHLNVHLGMQLHKMIWGQQAGR